MIGGPSFSVGTCNKFKTLLLREGIFHIFVTGTVIFNFPNMLATSMFNRISSMGIGFGSNSCTGGVSGGTTFSVDGGGVVVYDGGAKALFLLVYVKYSLFLSSFL
jgi:hypothetical protein